MPSFNFFKRKKRIVTNFDVKDSESHSNLSTSTQQEHDNRISINDALILLEKMEQDITRNLLIELDKIFDDTNQVLKHINNVADDLEKEEIVIEEEKLTPLVKNTKNTIVRALKRESSNILSKPKNFEDFVNFKNSLDSSINRFGEVTSSHSRIVNTFMKKHANSLRGDLKKISDYLEKLNDGYTNIKQEKAIIESLRSDLLNVKSKNNDMNNTINAIKMMENECKKLNELIDRNKDEISKLKSSSEYEKGLKYLRQKESIDKEKS
jgi:hypothetical protein